MSAPPAPGVSSSPPPLHAVGRVRHFWQRISEGRQLDELWSQFTADARASYGFYMKEADSEELGTHRGFKRWFRIAKTAFLVVVDEDDAGTACPVARWRL